MTRRLCTLFCALCMLLLALGSARSAVFYVAADAVGAGTGASWHDAFTSIQAGIDAAHSAGGGEVWVKSGTYQGFACPPSSDRFEERHPNAVDIVGEERDVDYTSSGESRSCHISILYLKGDVEGSTPSAKCGDTTDQDSFADRLRGLVGDGSEFLVFANHPSYVIGIADMRIFPQDLADAANAGALHAMELTTTEDVAKWDYALANLDDQAGDCSKILWGIRADDQHIMSQIGFERYGAMMGCIPTVDQDPVYADRRLAFKDMIRRGSFVCLPRNQKCEMPKYTLERSGGSASRMRVEVYLYAISGATSAMIRFYGCDYATGNTPGTLLYTAPLTMNADNAVDYCLTTTGGPGGQPLTPAQKANIKYIRPVITWYGPNSGHAYLQPVRIRSNGDWWDGPAYTLAGAHGTVGPSPYPVGDTDTGDTVYFNTHCHTTESDGDSSPSAMRDRYWENYAGLDPTRPRFTVVTDHDRRTPFALGVSSVMEMKEGVEIYGGFAGWETDRDQRNWTANPTSIDGQSAGRCVQAIGTYWSDRTAAVLDGFIIRNGNAEGTQGGGMYMVECSPTIRNCVFAANRAAYGGGISVYAGSSPLVVDCTFTGNQANGRFYGGGAVYVRGSYSRLINCSMIGNNASFGGAVNIVSSQTEMTGCELIGNAGSIDGGAVQVVSSHVMITDCTFSGNTSPGDGGAIRGVKTTGMVVGCEFASNSAGENGGRGGGISTSSRMITVTNSTFIGNSAYTGGGIFSEESDALVENCIFAGNRSVGEGGAICSRNQAGGHIAYSTIVGNSASRGGALSCLDSRLTVVNNIMAFNSGGISAAGLLPTLLHNDVYSNLSDYDGISPGQGDISADPAFVDLSARDYRLTSGSPCIDAGTKSISGLSVRDIAGVVRPSGSGVDMGAHEFPVLRTSPRSTADGDPVSLDNGVVTAAFADLFYVEADSREYGIRVCKDDHGLAEGMRASVTGVMRTNEHGERYIEADTAVESGAGSVEPVGMIARTIGGGSSVGQSGVVGGAGLTNVGLLIRTWGRVTSVGSGYLYIDDGSALQDGSGETGVRIVCDPSGFETGDLLEVTGISSCFTPVAGKIGRCVLTRGQGDLKRVQAR